MKKVRFIDLFSGLGSFHLAMKSNFGNDAKCNFAADIDKHSVEIYKANFNIDSYNDITKIDYKEIPNHDILFAGFPCQPFSAAGKKQGFKNQTKGTLFFNILEIIDNKNPRIVVLENVFSIRTHDKGKTFDVIIKSLQERGYFVSEKTINSSELSSAQNRSRVIIVASKEKEFVFPRVKKRKIKSLNNIQLNKENIIDASKYIILDEKYTHLTKNGLMFSGYLKGNTFKTANQEKVHLSRLHRQTNRIYSTKGVLPALAGSESSGRYHIYDGEIVFKLNVHDAYRIMNFPKNYKKVGTDGQLFKRIGNSIDVKLSKAVVKAIKEQFYG